MEINKELFSEGRVAMQKKSVLLIEDEKDLAECLTNLFEDWNMAVSIAFDLATVRSIIEQNRHFDLIILDAFLRGQKSLDLIPQLKSLPGNPTLVMMSGEILDNVRNQSILNGAHVYIQKPFTFSELETLISKAMNAQIH